MSRWLRRKYRIVTDRYCGYEVQVWRWWFPVWIQAGGSNTHATVERAEAYARRIAGRIIKQLADLNEQPPSHSKADLELEALRKIAGLQ